MLMASILVWSMRVLLNTEVMREKERGKREEGMRI